MLSNRLFRNLEIVSADHYRLSIVGRPILDFAKLRTQDGSKDHNGDKKWNI